MIIAQWNKIISVSYGKLKFTKTKLERLVFVSNCINAQFNSAPEYVWIKRNIYKEGREKKIKV